jgi:hypothetical protein
MSYEPPIHDPRHDEEFYREQAEGDCSAMTCSPFWYGIGAFFVAPVAAIFCILMGVMMILAWPFIPFLCYIQKKEEISKANVNSDGIRRR